MNLVIWAMFGMIIIALMGIISNTGATATANIGQQLDRLGCPMPSQTGLWNNTGTITYTNYTYNYEAVNLNTLTLTCSEIHTLDGYDYQFGVFEVQPFFSNGTGFQFGVAIGWAFYLGDAISEIFANKLVAIFTIVSYFLAPINFDIFGFTLADISGVALMVIIGIYIFAYLPIAIFLYKVITPFAGLG